MGLGKTLSIISLIVTNYRDGKPLIEVDKSTGVQQTVTKKKVFQHFTNRKELKLNYRDVGKDIKLMIIFPQKPAVSRKRGRKSKESHGEVVTISDDDEEPPLPSLNTKDDVDYKPIAQVGSVAMTEGAEANGIASQRTRR